MSDRPPNLAGVTAEQVRHRESCQQCGFDSDLYDRADTISSQMVIPALLEAAAEGLGAADLGARPNKTTWSIVEYIDHLREVVFGNRFAIEMALSSPGVDLGDPPETALSGGAKQLDLATVLDGVRTEYQLMRELLLGLDELQWQVAATLEGEPRTVGWFARHVLHDGLHHLGDIGRIRHGFGHGAKTETGAVSGLHISDGGVPKRPVDSVVVGPAGVHGDSQADRLHHGRPVQAVCLWSAEVIAQLQAEGHPIAAGSAGENITVEGIDWVHLRPGARIRVGAVPMLVSAHAIPCAKNAQWFSDRSFNRILHDEHPGSSRLYAIPLGSAAVFVGDPIVVEP